ncbi:MAG: non-homologous end-joining DNA ligase, partial [Luteitalea sp.]
PAPRGALARAAHWVRPDLVAEVAFTEWTAAGKIRHPSFQGLREDKPARQVVRERSSAPASSPTMSAPRRAVVSSSQAPAAQVAGVTITHPDRVVYPEPPITKLDLARYIEAIGSWMLPHVAERPLTLVFCPDGIDGECTYLKHGKPWGPKALRRVKIREKTKVGEYMVADSIEGLVSIMQMNWLETHTWNCTVDRLEQPDRLVFDLDPGPEVRWAQVVTAAREVRAVLAAEGLQSWLKTTGGRGLHVVVPMVRERSWGEGLGFAERVAGALVAAAPSRYTTNFAKVGREGLILIDVKRNIRGSTVVAAFSPRARPGAPVSTPLAWDELSARRRPDRWTVRTVPRRLEQLGADPWADYWVCAQALPR